jgi:hypothetical protein
MLALVMVSGCLGCDSNPGGPSAPSSISSSADPAVSVKAGQTPAGLAKGKALTKGGVTVVRKSAIKTAVPAASSN